MPSAIPVTVVNSRRIPGARYHNDVTITLPSSYPTNGFVLTPSLFGLDFAVDYCICESATSAGKPVFFDAANKKIKVFSAIGTEVSASVDLSTETLNVVAVGY